jgi:hypothetical protein
MNRRSKKKRKEKIIEKNACELVDVSKDEV